MIIKRVYNRIWGWLDKKKFKPLEEKLWLKRTVAIIMLCYAGGALVVYEAVMFAIRLTDK